MKRSIGPSGFRFAKTAASKSGRSGRSNRCTTRHPRWVPVKGANMSNSVQLHRVLRAAPEKVYRAFIDPDAMAKWLPPNGFTGKVHQIEAKVGGTYRMSFTNFTTGRSHSFGGEYLELVPNERIRHTDTFEDPNLPGEMRTTIALRPVSCGTELTIVQ